MSGPVPEVVAIRWPEERDDAARFVAAGVAVLYLVTEEDDPPTPSGCLEDWVRVPGDDRDLRARFAALELRAALHHAPPFVDDDGRVHHGGKIVALNSNEARLAAVLAAHLGMVISDEELLEAIAQDVTRPPSLRGEVGRLRSRLRDVDLAIRRARHGYVLIASP
jgi:DNA-binding response OmpR family regulator